MIHEKYCLFNGCDEWILPFIDLAAFEESLLLNILFQRKILIHESYFFNSHLLASHIRQAQSRTGISLFECAAQKGIIVPAVRDHQAGTFGMAYENMERQFDQSRYKIVSDEIQPYKRQIIHSVERGLKASGTGMFYWPLATDESNTLGVQYLNLLRDVFQGDAPRKFGDRSAERQQWFLRVWEEKAWRYDVIEKAAEATQRNGNKGLQRMELLRHLGWALGMPKDMHNLNAAEIYQFAGDAETRVRAMTFMKWVSQCHHLAQSRIFQTTLNFPVYDQNNDFLVDSIFLNKLDKNAVVPGGGGDNEYIRVQTRLPPIEVLIATDPRNLIDISADYGEGYRGALEDWEKNPTDKAKSEVVTSLTSYCGAICSWYKSVRKDVILTCETHKHKQWGAKDLALSIADTAGIVLKALGQPLFGMFVSLTKDSLVQCNYATAAIRKKAYALQDNSLEISLQNPEI